MNIRGQGRGTCHRSEIRQGDRVGKLIKPPTRRRVIAPIVQTPKITGFLGRAGPWIPVRRIGLEIAIIIKQSNSAQIHARARSRHRRTEAGASQRDSETPRCGFLPEFSRQCSTAPGSMGRSPRGPHLTPSDFPTPLRATLATPGIYNIVRETMELAQCLRPLLRARCTSRALTPVAPNFAAAVLLPRLNKCTRGFLITSPPVRCGKLWLP